ncbi:uncharacterized protein LOC111252276 [Varroa destructor]|uniref:Uncharacterized protein n=1 Tax=Varroa destructor TaxID=109461 RepID=A0A7M7MI56_VARDE|nr:uncharacterized protein LOC111252276 [Varroa destructor]
MVEPTLVQTSPGQWPCYPELVYYKNISRDARKRGPIRAIFCLIIALTVYADTYYCSIVNSVLFLPQHVSYLKYAICGLMLVLCLGHFASFTYVHIVPECEIEYSRAKLLNISEDDKGFKLKPDTQTVTPSLAPCTDVDKFTADMFRLPSDCQPPDTVGNDTSIDDPWQFRQYQPGNRISRLTDPAYDTIMQRTIEPNSRATDWHLEDERSADAFVRERSHEIDPLIGYTSETSYYDFSILGRRMPISLADAGVEAVHRLYQFQPYKRATEILDNIGQVCPASVQCSLFVLDPFQLFVLNRNLRFWFHIRVFSPLVEEITKVNTNMLNCGLGTPNLIGVASEDQLKYLYQTRPDLVPGLDKIIPFLQFTTNQEYLVNRYRDFCIGGALSKVNWSRGSGAWNENLPTDAELLMLAFCTYMDVRVPIDADYLEGRRFTQQHVYDATKEAETRRTGDDEVRMHKLSKRPPHYSLQIKHEMVDVGPGSANVFKVIFTFLFYQYHFNNGRICNMPMDASGFDVAQIIRMRNV